MKSEKKTLTKNKFLQTKAVVGNFSSVLPVKFVIVKECIVVVIHPYSHALKLTFKTTKLYGKSWDSKEIEFFLF